VIAAEAARAEAGDAISAVILGCAGMVGVAETVRQALTIDVIDPVACTARCMTWLCPRPSRSG
jgi:allantoin racemase